MRTATAGAAQDVVARLWLAALQELATLASHEVRGVLNGVSVNLEVVRSRAARPGTEAAAVASFAETAAAQLELLMRMSDAFLGLVRGGRAPVDAWTLLERLVALLDPAARASGGAVQLARPRGAPEAVTTVSGELARLVLTSALLAAMRGGGTVRCQLDTGSGITVRVRRENGTEVELDTEVAGVAADAGVRIERTDDGLALVFPVASGANAA